MKSIRLSISSLRSPFLVRIAIAVAFVAITYSIRPTQAQPRPYPSPSPSPAITARPAPNPTTPPRNSPHPSPSPSTSRDANGSAHCAADGALVVEVPGPNGKVTVFVYKNGCRVNGNASIDINDTLSAEASCALQVRDWKVDMTTDLLIKALGPEGVRLGELHLTCRRLHTAPPQERYSCALRFSGPTGKLIRQWIWRGNPEVVIVRCVGDTAEAVQDLVKEMRQRGIQFKDEHQLDFTTYLDDSGQTRWGLQFSF